MSDMQSLSDRIDEMEIYLTHQAQAIEDLNSVIARQWTQIEAMSYQLAKLGDRVYIVEEQGGEPAPAEPPPPHY